MRPRAVAIGAAGLVLSALPARATPGEPPADLSAAGVVALVTLTVACVIAGVVILRNFR